MKNTESASVNKIIDAVMKAVDGDADQRIDVSEISADYTRLADAINTLIEFVQESINEKKWVENAFGSRELKCRALFDSITDSVVGVDMKGTIKWANHIYLDMLGYTIDELHQMTYHDLTPQKWHRYEADIIENRVIKYGDSGVYVKEYRRKDGTVFPVEIRTYLVRNNTGEPVGMWGIVRDITERKLAEEERAMLESQLLQAQKLESIGRLAGGVAHDYNNMLSVIIGNVEIIKTQINPNSPFIEEVLEIEQAADQSREITRQLLGFSRKQVISPKPMSLNDQIAEKIKTIIRLIGEDIELIFKPGENTGTVCFDLGQIDQILVNLAINARDAMPRGGVLKIETLRVDIDKQYSITHVGARPGRYAVLNVNDNGAGMDRETLSHIFEPFFTTKEVGKGTGLGLSTVYGIIQQNGGFITVSSEPGCGSTFRLFIPAFPTDEKNVLDAVNHTEVINGTGTVLLVEDNENVRKMTSVMLQNIGYSVIVVDNPLEALALFEKNETHVDLLITDVIMPEISGPELRDRIHAVKPDLKVLYISGYTSDIIAQHGVLENDTHLLMKPFAIRELASIVSMVLLD